MIEVGEYIRAYRYGISKVTDEGIGETDKGDVRLIELDNNEWSEIGSWIKSHSKNIIDLIEVGDIINQSERILDITGDYILTTERNCSKSRFEKTIKTILTHEQYEQNCYKVGVD